jgi:hypothetical protein
MVFYGVRPGYGDIRSWRGCGFISRRFVNDMSSVTFTGTCLCTAPYLMITHQFRILGSDEWNVTNSMGRVNQKEKRNFLYKTP